MYDTPVILNLHDYKGIPTFVSGCQATDCSGRQKFMCGYPPSYARSQNTGNGISGITLMIKAALWPLFFAIFLVF